MLNKSVRPFACLSVLIISLYATVGLPPGLSPARVLAQTSVPPNQPERGLIYDGLDVATSGPCAGLYRLKGSDLCTHGPDPAPPGVDIRHDVPPLPMNTQVRPSSIVCEGEIGNRVQVMYVRASDHEDRFAQYHDSIRQWASQADDIFNASAAETGGSRHIRFVLNEDCTLSVLNVVLSETADDNFTNTKNELRALGYNRRDRKYMIFMDASILCGQGTFGWRDQPDETNPDNFGPSYGRTDNGCWARSTPAHELMHNLGGVQNSAPHTTNQGHCFDEYDVMCYADGPSSPPMQEICSATHENLFDCNHDDYYHTNPPANSYLATHWNTANNQFLIGAGPLIPALPVNLRIEHLMMDHITMTWDDASNQESGFKIYKWRWDGTAWQREEYARVGTNVTVFTDTGLRCNSSYFYQVGAYNSIGESALTSILKGTTSACSTNTPTPTPTSTRTPTNTPTPTATLTSTPIPTPVPTLPGAPNRTYMPFIGYRW